MSQRKAERSFRPILAMCLNSLGAKAYSEGIEGRSVWASEQLKISKNLRSCTTERRRRIWQDGMEEKDLPALPRESADTRSEVEQGGSPMSASRTIRTGELGNMAWTGNVAD